MKFIKDYFRPKQNEAAEFLPAALSVLETPPHPAPRVFLRIIFAALVLTLAWSYFGKTEVVAVTQGKIIPGGKSKTVQVFERATVSKIMVRDGQRVEEGQVLLELDKSVYAADLEQYTKELAFYRIEKVRTDAMLASLSAKKIIPMKRPDHAADGIFLEAQQRFRNDFSAWKSGYEQLSSQASLKQTEIRSLRNLLQQREGVLSVARERELNYQTLADQKFVPKNRHLEVKQEVMRLEGEALSIRNTVAERQKEIASINAQKRVLTDDLKKAASLEAQDAVKKIATLEQQLIKSKSNYDLTVVKSPVTGAVQQLAVHTVGGVVTPAQPVMVIVPENTDLEAEVTLLNKDIGFIKPGQEAHIKVEAFPYTKYGMIEGEVVSVSGDAIPDENLGAVYSGKVRLNKTVMRVNGNDVSLVPGMNVTVEIKTDTRRMIEYFLSPITVYKDEAFRER